LPHLREKEKTIRELKRITRRGGRIASVDEGGAFWYPPMPEFDGLFGKVAEWRRSTRKTLDGANEPKDALTVFRESGLGKVEAHPIPTFGSQKDPKHLRQLAGVPVMILEIHKSAVIDNGFMTEKEYADGMKEYKAWLSRPESFWMVLSILTVGRVRK
jgi:hypothetical protein